MSEDIDTLVNRILDCANEIERRKRTLLKKADQVDAHIAQMRAVLMFKQQHIANEDFLPHMSVRKLFRPSEILRYCREGLKEAGGCLDTRELARHVIIRKGLDSDDPVLRRKIVGSIQAVMKTARRKRIVTDKGRRKGAVLWVLL